MTVKRTSSGWCHTSASRYYKRIKNSEDYADVWTCVYDGGQHSKWNGEIPTVPTYSRHLFGWSWLDTDNDGQNSRAEALIAQSTGPITYTDDSERLVSRGTWRSPYTNAVLHDASDMDVDHIIPLKWAWVHGAWLWSTEQRKVFANDPRNLFSCEASINRSKGSRGPSEWLPDQNVETYLLRWRRLMLLYGFNYSNQEQTYLDANK